ncbi:MAG TPA: arabinofuranosidase catalytic domain-containing protein, partial [Polyangia bacterium]|nr:arabinofuranosidase catalytic domain-containing protein [Polyangia bacterium]
AYDGKAPKAWNLQGAIVLGVGGDNSNTSYGTFFEGAITAGRPSDATDVAVLQNIQAAGYGK